MLQERLDLSRRTIVVAGVGGGGIGTAMCRAIAEAGATVVALDIDETGLATARDALGPDARRHHFALADVRDEDSVEAALADAGSVDGLVHVVGGMRGDVWAGVADASLATVDDVLRLNLHSAFVTTAAVGRRLLDAGAAGSIVHVASIAGLASMPYGAAYAAAKAGMMALVRTAAVEWGRAGIRVNAVAAGTIRVAHSRAATGADEGDAVRAVIPLGRRGDPDDLAAAAVFLLSDLAAFVTGQVLAVDGGASARPGYLDGDDLPVFFRDEELRARLTRRRSLGSRADDEGEER
jgi:NAD(P)-dependent dehydrogenase (short-subunit alcohol dehydrogenase family)